MGRLRRCWTDVPLSIERILDAGAGEALEPIRSEIFGSTRMAQHGRSLGEAHRAERAELGQTSFYPRLRNNVRALRQAYRYVADEVRSGQMIGTAEEWLFDNFPLIEAQLRDIRESLPPHFYRSLPVLQDAPLQGLPRIYGVAWAYVAHTDSAFDEHLLVEFLDAYQDSRELKHAELWALPTTLRVVLIENLRRLADRITSHRAARKLASLCATRCHELGLVRLQAMHAQMVRRGVGDTFVCSLAHALEEYRATADATSSACIRAWLHEAVPDLLQLQTQETANQTADQLSIGNAMTALRRMASTDWQDTVNRCSRVVRVMLQSPVFAAEDNTTRNATLHGIERMSVRTGRSEGRVAQALMAALTREGPASQPSLWLEGPGRYGLEALLGVKNGRLLPWALPVTHATLYLSTLALACGALVWGLLALQQQTHLSASDGVALWAAGLAIALVVSEAVVALVNRLISESVPPRHMPRLLLADGIPPEARVMVAIPCLLSHRNSIDALVWRLQLHHLASAEPCVQFALLTDWLDADTACDTHDAALLEHAAKGLRELNQRYPVAAGEPVRFVLLHRTRSWCATQGRWLGWERKRGKLEQLVAALATDTAGAFLDLGDLSRLAPGTRYLLTLDSDTQLPPGQLRSLVGVAEHPLNQPVLDTSGRQVVTGYGVLQPRVVPPLPNRAEQTPWRWLWGGRPGMDSYSAMTSNAYQDLLGEGSFTGKGLLHVATWHAVLGGQLPAERVLSHDLLEGAWVRCAVVSDVTLLEPDLTHSDADLARQHRWMRGDWQLLPFVLNGWRWPLSAINRWKLLDNLRRSLVAPAAVALLALSMTGQGLPWLWALGVVASAYAAGPLMGALAAWVPRRRHLALQRFVAMAALDALRAVLGGVWSLAVLLQQALSALDAVSRTVFRLVVSRRWLLQWTSAEASQAGLGIGLWPTLRRHGLQPVLVGVWALWLWGLASRPDPTAWLLLAVWASAPALVWLANRPWPRAGATLAAQDRTLLQGVARDTWRFFERCVNAESHRLPPDNLQSAPFEMVAHRTSPTNIGLYLLSVACARQFGWIGTQDLLARLEATLGTLHQLERFRGHFLNWYDTQTLAPLAPRYVSTVDSGNLGVHLLAVAQACSELAQAPCGLGAGIHAIALSRQRLQAHRALLMQALHQPLEKTALGRLLDVEPEVLHDGSALERLRALLQAASQELASIPLSFNPSIVDRTPTARDRLHWLLEDHINTWSSLLRDCAASAAGGDTPVSHTSSRLQALAAAFEALAWEADFRFLYHPQRQLLHIGYRPEAQQLDAAFYDLLASESRSTSLLAMAKGDVPVKHWAALGRPFCAIGRHAALRSWSGSMFEYLMPPLVLAEPPGSALADACRCALIEQQRAARGTGLPWGWSESACAVRDQSLAYQYGPQGVARLALRRPSADERVMAPYATVLATQLDTRAACANLRHFSRLGAQSRFGFFEALDCSPSRQPQGKTFTVVRTTMAHHQGMSVVALANVLLDGVAQRWGAGNPRLQAMGLLLHERAPRDLSPPPPLPDLPSQEARLPAPLAARTWTPGVHTLEPTHLLSNGRYSVTLRPNGAGWSRYGEMGVGRWRDDALRDAHGGFVYVRRSRNAAPVSLTSHPAPDKAARYLSHFHADRVVYVAQWPDLQAQTTVWVSAEDDIELRQVQLHNQSDLPIELELISAFDVTLASHAADEAHPVFSGLFVKADWLPDQQALRFVRTPRLPTEQALQAAHFVTAVQGDTLGLRYQTDRALWLGRHHPASQPLGQLLPVPQRAAELATGLDPVAALGVRVRLAPGTQACVTFATTASHDAATLLACIDKYRQASYVERSSLMSATLANMPSVVQRMHTHALPALHTLTTALVMTLPKSDGPDGLVLPPRGPQEMDRRLLWPLGLSGDRPMLLVSVDSVKGLPLLRTLLQAQEEWARAGLATDLVVITHEVHSYQMPLQRELATLTQQSLSAVHGDRWAMHHLRHDRLTAGQLGTLHALARVYLHADGRSLQAQVVAWSLRHTLPGEPVGTTPRVTRLPVRLPVRLPLVAAEHSQGRFSTDGRVFSFEVSHRQRPARPWINVLTNPTLGCLLSDSGAGHTWAVNSRLNQITAWSNDPVSDPPGEWWLLQDRDSGETWSATPSAWGAPGARYETAHTQGLSTIAHQHHGLRVSVGWCVDPVNTVKQVRIRLSNQGHTTRSLRITGMVEWLLGERRGDRATLLTQPAWEQTPGVLLGLLCTQTDRTHELGGATAFLSAPCQPGEASDGWDWGCDRRVFFDPNGQLALSEQLGQRSGLGLDPCAALSCVAVLPPGAQYERVFLIGYAPSEAAARALMAQAGGCSAQQREDSAQAQWDTLLHTTQVSTPDPLFDALVNRWLLYQTVSSRLWAKAGFYQAGGATGFRDQLQDAMALVWTEPARLRAQVVLCASRQFPEGDVQHWWHAPTGAGVRTHSCDDLLWLPYATSHYLQSTGDAGVLDEEVPFLLGSPIPDGAEDCYEAPPTSTHTASVYEHGARAIDRSLRVGAHGLPLMGGGDWNDGMNRVGHEGRGESVWLGWFLCVVVKDWLALARQRADTPRMRCWEQALAQWRWALRTVAWDGQWFKRAFFDDGSALGSRHNTEARIDLIAQVWAVLSDEAPPERQRQVMQAVQTELVDDAHGLIRLLTPPLAKAHPSAGYIQAYPPGVRENGGQYTHAGAWALMAAAAVATRETDHPYLRNTPYRLFTLLSPAHRAAHPARGPVYGLEPYAVAADVYSQPPYTGRGGWSWYTGAAGWLYRGAMESIMGLRIQGNALWLTPCLPLHWPRADIKLQRDGRRLHLVLLRGNLRDAQTVCSALGATVWPPAQPLLWSALPPVSCWVRLL